MLQRIRERLTGMVAGGVLVLIAIAFIFWGVDFGFFTRDYVARVNGEELSNVRFQNAFQSQLSELQRYYRDELSESLRAEVRANTIEGLIRSMLVEQVVREENYRVSDEALFESIRAIPIFQVAGEFSIDSYRAQLAGRGLSPSVWEADQRQYLEVSQLQNGIIESAFTTPSQARRLIELVEEQREVAYARIDADALAADLSIAEEAIAAYYEEHQSEYTTPETVTLEYVQVSVDEVAAEVEVTEEGIAEYYETVKGRFEAPERRRVRHILIESSDDAESTAAELARRAREGEDFAELAREHSQDAGTAELGGDLDWIDKGVFEGALEEAIFSLEVGEISDPVLSDFGYHVLRVDEIQVATSKPLEEVRAEIEAEYRKVQAEGRYYDRAERLAELTFENPDDLQIAAEDLGIEVIEVQGFTRFGTGDLAAFPQVAEAAFTTAVLEDGENSRLLELDDGRAIVLRVAAHQLPEQRPLEEVREQIVAALRLQEARSLAARKGETLIGTIEGGLSLAISAVAAGAEYHEPARVVRNAPELPPELVAALFLAPRPVEGPVLRGLALNDGDFVVYEFTAVEPGRLDAQPRERRLEERQAIAQQLGNQDLNTYVSRLREEARVLVFEDDDQQP